MQKQLNLDALPYACGAILLGIVTVAVQDFALTWQPVPPGLPARAPLAVLSGLVLLLGGAAILWRGARRLEIILPTFYALWVVALHLPNTVANPSVASLLGVAEIGALSVGGFAAVIAAKGSRYATVLPPVFGACAIIFGLSHFVYADFTASMVPSWIPGKLFCAYFTGAAHIAAGIAMLIGRFARLAAMLLAAMCASFVILLHAPRVAAAPGSRVEWTMLAAALSIAGAAWLLRSCIPMSTSEHLDR
ncbi:DoxX family membrane protein [Sphingomonas piscis]|uniref:DoxX family membrane protein n=1 Tax=Sphingomonas piscis TaxID=2714943 RepID=A0A6G7YLW8_9SPHN|nr:DoxX family membrane protein [Sphingomonas piscis]QIK77745.1 DoxX family membrane protein [Sphingomonas piscis]